MVYLKTTFEGKPFEGAVASLSKDKVMLVIGSTGILKVSDGTPVEIFPLEDYAKLGISTKVLEQCKKGLEERLGSNATNDSNEGSCFKVYRSKQK